MSHYDKWIEFFDMHADGWDARLKDFDFSRLNQIIDRVGVSQNAHVVDVACGTGILTTILLEKGITNIVGIDISSKMIEVYKSKFPAVKTYVGPFEDQDFGELSFDCVFIFNAFPHFYEPDSIFHKAKSILKPGGKLVVAHSMNREQLNEHHRKAGKTVEKDILISDHEFKSLYDKHGFQDVVVEDGEYFFSCGCCYK